MSIDCYQLKEVIVKPALAAIGLYSDDAVALMMGTCAQETALGTYIVQKGIGYEGGIGIYQLQAPSYYDVWENKIQPYPNIRAKIKLYLGYEARPPIHRIAADLSLATIMTRFYYSRVIEPIPNRFNIEALGQYWKKYWNTEKGKGTVQQFIDNYKQYVTC